MASTNYGVGSRRIPDAPTEPMPDRRDPAPPTAARLYLSVVGIGLVLGGVGGFLYESDFGRGDDLIAADVLGLFPTNGTDNVLHLVLGVVSLAAASRAARPAALAVGGLLAVLGLWGMLETDEAVGSLLATIPVDGADNVLHLLVGFVGVGAGALSPAGESAGGGGPRRRDAQGRRLRS
jgi:hypothetical protein